MWVRKSAEQVAMERRALWVSFKGPAFWFVVIFFCFIGKGLLGTYLPQQRGTFTWPEILVCSTLFAVVGAVVIYVLQLTRE